MGLRSLLLVVGTVAVAGVLAWALRSEGLEGPALPELGGPTTAGAGGDVAAGGVGGDRIAVSDPALPSGEEPLTVDPNRARESSRLVVVGVPRSRRADASRFVGARVELSSTAAKRPRVVRLDADLRAVFERLDPVETFELVVLPGDGLRTLVAEIRLAPGEERHVEVELAVGGTLFGRVVDQRGGPLPSATLMVRSSSDSGEPEWLRRAILTPDGSFEARGIRPGRVWAELHAGAVNLVEELGDIEEGQSLGPIDLRLPEGEVLEGTVRWPDGAPAARARVAASLRDPLAGAARTVYALTDEDGHYRLEALARAPYELHARPGETRPGVPGADGHRAWGEALPPRTLDLTLEPGLSISGTIVDDLGAPAPSFRVVAEQRRGGEAGPTWRVSTESVQAETGAFVLRGLRPGNWMLTASDRGGVSVVEEELELVADRSGLLLVLPRPARVTGVVRDTAGVGRAGEWVYVIPAPRDDGRVEPRAPRRALSRSGGLFTIERVAPGRVLVGRSSDDPRAVAIVLAPGEQREGVVITLDD